MRVSAGLVVLCLLFGSAAQSANAPLPGGAPAGLAAHRALYKLTLNKSRGGRQVVSAHGTMGYEVTDVCDGWASRQRLRIAFTNADDLEVETDSDYTTWEARDGLSFRFHMTQKTDGAITSQTDGGAKLSRAGGAGEARYRLPALAVKKLPAGTLFPMMHTLTVISAAREGRKFFAVPLFDGTDENGVEDSSIVVLDWKPPFETAHKVLNPLPSTRVRLAFFDRQSSTGTPSYEVAMRYWENGIADAMLMEFPDFAMDAKLTELTPLPRRC